ncbi:DUF1624 domain-containing protein [Hymenobacter lucidus]|uniref:Heparan-alpha-glucosaminide N-acetyltransferase domain-containing protein n=1 Tax=Hymenobacter lucidus TaxID=2880930 RepID=A0ABS8ARF7_9BACT|nr:heparan-alpha-glucosaminide N-acetyltransferase domain-containing protein [Hymenobacter lucidus]MCB2407911.1 heparan-alpha-glucosaminide N-acetyltransferase domain-containing protein [Hymenobacter lucidus]
MPLVSPLPARVAAARVPAIDLVRGLVMVIMALDHVREFWSPTPVRPEDIAQTSILLFFSRWITHFCAPTFVLLAGVSIFLYQQKQPNRRRVSWFLLTRGLWLVALELLVISPILQWSYQMILLQVIWAVGWGMVLLAGLLWLPRWLLGVLAFGMLAGQHLLLPGFETTTPATVALGLFYHTPFLIPPSGLPAFLMAYTIGPWAAVLAAGYWLGPWFLLPPPERTRRLRLAGVGLLLGFVVLRATNWYGDPAPWSPQVRGLAYSVLSFLNVAKYPPSLLFLSLTLGTALLLLSSPLGAAQNRLSEVLRTFGRVPFFYYLLHLLLISASALLWTYWQFGQPVNLGFLNPKEWPAAYQPSLLRAYVVWLLVVVALYWPCRWYQRFKQRHAYWWLSYL